MAYIVEPLKFGKVDSIVLDSAIQTIKQNTSFLSAILFGTKYELLLLFI